MRSVSDTFSLFAELSLALVGFAGVAAASSGRARDFSERERFRLDGIVILSTNVLASSLAYRFFSHAGTSLEASLFGSGWVGLLFSVAYAARIFPEASGVTRAEPFARASWIAYAGLVLILCEIALYGVAALAIIDASTLVGVFTTQLVHGIWMFWRLLTLSE